MTSPKIICFYHPTSVVIVDDNTVFLENLPENLSDQSKYSLFDAPQKALEYLDGQKKLLLTSDDFAGKTDDLATGKSLNINLPKICSLAENKNRFETPLVVIVDYDMPHMNGLEFCQKLDGQYKKIMLTAAADDKLAVQAFNDGIIDKFIAKDDPNIFEKIDQAVNALQQSYFAVLSMPIVKELSTTPSSFFANPIFQDFLKGFMQKNNINEFYLIDAMGSFLLINNKNERFWLSVQSDQQIENYLQIIQDDDNAPEEIINALDKKEKLLCLFSEEDFNQSVENWGAYLHPAHKIEDLNYAYYAYYSFIRIE